MREFVLQGIQITATTPTSSAVRLETGLIDLDLSNRVQTKHKDKVFSSPKHHRLKVFVNLRVSTRKDWQGSSMNYAGKRF